MAPAVAAPAAGKWSRRERSWRRSRNSRRPRHCRAAARAAATPGLPSRLEPERGRCDGRRRDGHARTRRRVAAPARPAPANSQTVDCKTNASGGGDPSRPTAAIQHQSGAGAEIAQCRRIRSQADWRGLWRRSDSRSRALRHGQLTTTPAKAQPRASPIAPLTLLAVWSKLKRYGNGR